MARRRRSFASTLGSPFLRHIRGDPAGFDRADHPFNIPAFGQGLDLELSVPVTFFVGENGSGKSTLLEGLAECIGFDPEGGSPDHQRAALAERSDFAQALRLAWKPKVTEGFFLRAESFFNVARYLDQVSSLDRYGGKPLHGQSHGEAFLALFAHRFEQGIYLLDEPEAALSPQRQLSFLQILHGLAATHQAQFLIATHSPILLAYPGANIFSLDDHGIHSVAYQETQHYQVTRDFLNNPALYLRHLFQTVSEDDPPDPQP